MDALLDFAGLWDARVRLESFGKVVDVTKKTSGKTGQWRAKSASGDGRRVGASDLFAWAADRDERVKISETLATKDLSGHSNQNGKNSKNSRNSKSSITTQKTATLVNIDDARADRAHRNDSHSGRARRSYRTRGLGAIVPRLTRKAIGNKANMDADLQIYWRDIVGEEFAQATFPRRSRFDAAGRRVGGVLELVVQRGYGAFLTHAKGQLLDKLNAYLGIGTYRDVKIKEGPLPQRSVSGGGGAKGSGGTNRRHGPLMQIDMSDPATRANLGIASGLPHGQETGSPPMPTPISRKSGKIWVPPVPKRHELALRMDDRGGTGVGHKPLAEALTYLGASLANQDQ